MFEHAEHPDDCLFCAAGEGSIHAYEPPSPMHLEIIVRRYSTILVDDNGCQHGYWTFTGGQNSGWVGRPLPVYRDYREWLNAADAYVVPTTDALYVAP